MERIGILNLIDYIIKFLGLSLETEEEHKSNNVEFSSYDEMLMGN